MKSLRIIYMGTPAFAISPLEQILESEDKVVAVITAPDRKSGRGKKLTPSPIKVFCEEHDLPVLQPPNLKDPALITQLRELAPDVMVVVAFRMLPKEVWSIPPNGTFNLHASLLPKYRGAAPIHWAIINGEQQTGVTTFFINEQIDTGEIIAQKSLSIGLDENTGQLSNRLEKLGATLTLETLDLIATNCVNSSPQPNNNQASLAPKLTRENTQLQWDQDGQHIERKVRGLQPFPCAWTMLSNNDQRLYCKIHDVYFIEEKQPLKGGQIFVENQQIMVAVPNGTIHVKRLQLPNKKPMSDKELLNGYSVDAKASFENP
ncbi:MAG: methionyl-tRNA formyltransferase [Flavobacteriaceae bacterium TMED81]|nr:MAG: methionyl-tRNA formyltransferase [Flavobacteriaceae bacterium TMED81]